MNKKVLSMTEEKTTDATKLFIVADDLVKDAERYRYIRTKVKMLSAAKNAPPTFVVTIFNDLAGIDLTQGNKAKNFDDAVDIAKFISNLKSKEQIMNEKLLNTAKEAGFYLETPNGEEHYAIPMLEKFAERVLANADVDNLKADIDTYVKISSEQAKVICDLEDILKLLLQAKPATTTA